MDAFSEVLSGVRLKGAMYFSAECSACPSPNWCSSYGRSLSRTAPRQTPVPNEGSRSPTSVGLTFRDAAAKTVGWNVVRHEIKHSADARVSAIGVRVAGYPLAKSDRSGAHLLQTRERTPLLIRDIFAERRQNRCAEALT